MAVREIVDAQVKPMLRTGSGLLQIQTGIPAEEGGHPVVVMPEYRSTVNSSPVSDGTV